MLTRMTGSIRIGTNDPRQRFVAPQRKRSAVSGIVGKRSPASAPVALKALCRTFPLSGRAAPVRIGQAVWSARAESRFLPPFAES